MTDNIRLPLLRRALGLAAVALFAATWPLWSMPPAPGTPHVPWLGVLCGVPFAVDRTALVFAAVGVLLMLAGPRSDRWTRIGAGGFVCGGLVLVLLDQHRLQPWMYQFLIAGTLLVLAPGRVGLACWRGLVVSIYIYSAVSKLDAAFLESHGQLLLSGFLKPAGIDPGLWTPGMRTTASALFPFGELAIGLLLIPHRTRGCGLSGSILMHVALLWTLGPLGLDHEPGVLLWNVFFIGQNLLLFLTSVDGRLQALSRPVAEEPDSSSVERETPLPEPRRGAAQRGWFVPAAIHKLERFPSVRLVRELSPLAARWGALAARWLTGVVLTVPILETWGWWDHWPGWAVYASRPAQVRLWIDDSAVGRLPDETARFLGSPAPLETRFPLRLEAWSFATRRCPIYPQLRYRLAVARALLGEDMPEDAVTVSIASTPGRFSGARERIELHGLEELDEFLRGFRVNTTARPD